MNIYKLKAKFWYIFPEASITTASALFGFLSGANIILLLEYRQDFKFLIEILLCLLISACGLFLHMYLIIPLREKCKEYSLSYFETEENVNVFLKVVGNIPLICVYLFLCLLLLCCPLYPIYKTTQVKTSTACLEIKKLY